LDVGDIGNRLLGTGSWEGGTGRAKALGPAPHSISYEPSTINLFNFYPVKYFAEISAANLTWAINPLNLINLINDAAAN